ncbi:MAG: ester cyclase [candidate division Zixibacteria bacterium]
MTKRRVIFTIILLFVVASLSCSPGGDDQAIKNKIVVMRVFDALNNHEYDDLDKYIAKDYVRHCQATPDVTVESLDDFKALLSGWDQAFPNAELTIDLIAAEGDLVAFYGPFSGTHEGQMGQFPATGKSMVSETAGFHRLENGKIVETWVTWDNLAVMNQLGLFPPPSGDKK